MKEENQVTSIYPISMEKHIIFVIFASVFFLLQFIRTKRWYQLILAAAFPISLLIYVDESNHTFFYGVGITEFVLLCAAMVANIAQSRKDKKKKAAEKEAKAQEEQADSPETDADQPETPADEPEQDNHSDTEAE